MRRFAPAFWLVLLGASSVHSSSSRLVGTHKFGVQFIWDRYGTATIQARDKELWIEGLQVAPQPPPRPPMPTLSGPHPPPPEISAEEHQGRDFVSIEGRLRVLNANTFQVTGTLRTRIASCCGAHTLHGTFEFRKSGQRAFYRLQEPGRLELCPKNTCHYYIDLFVN